MNGPIERVAFILLLNILFFWKTIYYAYVSDDIPIYQRKREWKNKWQKLLELFNGDARVEMQLDHFVTMLFHAVICALIYLAFGASDTSFLAALLFTFNPTNNQGSVWISGRGYTLPALCVLSAMALPWLSLPIFILCTWYTVGFMAPLAVIGGPQWWTLAFLPIAWLINGKKFKGNVKKKFDAEAVNEDKTFHPRKLILAVKTVGFYFTTCLLPFRVTFFHNFLQSCAGNEVMKKRAYTLCKFFWVGVAAIGGFLIYTIMVPWSITHWGLLWFFIQIAPFSNIRRHNQEIADRFAYIPNIGLMVALACVLAQFPAVATFFLGYYAAMLWSALGMYKDDFWVMEFSACQDPNAWFTWHTRAHKRWAGQSYKEALTFWVMARNISPKEFKLLYNIAVVLRLLNNHEESKKFYAEAKSVVIPGQEPFCNDLFARYDKGEVMLLV